MTKTNKNNIRAVRNLKYEFTIVDRLKAIIYMTSKNKRKQPIFDSKHEKIIKWDIIYEDETTMKETLAIYLSLVLLIIIEKTVERQGKDYDRLGYV